jgi:hypothetical protein
VSKPASELAYLFRALKAPAAARALPANADRAREEGWSYERFAGVLLGIAIQTYLAQHTENPQPFKWTQTAEQILARSAADESPSPQSLTKTETHH